MATRGHMIVQSFNPATGIATVMVGPAGAQMMAEADKAKHMLEFRKATPMQAKRSGVPKPMLALAKDVAELPADHPVKGDLGSVPPC